MTDSFRWKAALVILVAVIVRFAFAIAVDRGVIKSIADPDAWDYMSFAHNLATGVGYAHAFDQTQPFSKQVEFSAWRPPLYPAFLATAFQASRNFWFLRSLLI